MYGSRTSTTEFIKKAIDYYSGVVMLDESQSIFADSINRLVGGIVSNSKNRIVRIQFKEAVELAKVFHILAYMNELGDETIKKLHDKCVDEVKIINGIINIEDAYIF